MLTVPASGAWKPLSTLTRVVLPAPLGPIRPSASPGRASGRPRAARASPPKPTTIPSARSPAPSGRLSGSPSDGSRRAGLALGSALRRRRRAEELARLAAAGQAVGQAIIVASRISADADRAEARRRSRAREPKTLPPPSKPRSSSLTLATAKRADHRAEDAARAADDQHRQRRHRGGEVEGGGAQDAGLLHREGAADPAEQRASVKANEAAPGDRDPQRAGGDLVLAASPAGDSRSTRNL